MLRMRRILRVIGLACGLCTALSAQTTAPAETTSSVAGAAPAFAPLPPELQAELDALLPQGWQPSATVRGSVGWRDNILLSPFAPLGRAFGRGEIEAMLWRPRQRQWEFLSFLNGDVLRYLSPPAETGGEQQWSLHADARWRPIERFRASLKATGYLRDMVVDLSETEASRVVAPTRVRGGYLTATVRLGLPLGLTLEPALQGKRTNYRDYPGDYEEARGGARLQGSRSPRLTASAGWFEHRRRYAERAQFTAGGRALPGTRLRFLQRDGDLKLQTNWQGGGEWTAAVSAGRLENRDEASGYFDYDQQRGRLELNWQRGAWRATFDGDARRVDYINQTVGAGIAPPGRMADDYEVRLRGERDLKNAWTLFAEHRWERSRSNEPGFSYRANTALAGVQRGF